MIKSAFFGTLSLSMFEYQAETGPMGAPDNNDLDQEDQFISWSADEYVLKSKGFGWYLAVYLVGIIAAALVIFFYYQTLILMISMLLVVIACVVAIQFVANKKPKNINYSLDKDTVKVNGKIYALVNFKSFFVTEKDGIEEVRLSPVSETSPTLALKLNDGNKDQVVDILSDAVPYQEKPISWVEKFSSKIGL